MRDRFTHKSKTERGRMRRSIREEVLWRDNYTCQFCGWHFDKGELTIDHLVPMARGGLDEITNYVTCCEPCNQRKSDMPLEAFVHTIAMKAEELPVHGDPIINNESLPIELRLLRKRIFDKARISDIQITGTNAQKKLEKAYRRDFWETSRGKELEAEFPTLPGHARVMIPEIQIAANSEREFLLLVELAKSANTRNLIGTILTADMDIEKTVRAMGERTSDAALQKRLGQALKRFEKETRKRRLEDVQIA